MKTEAVILITEENGLVISGFDIIWIFWNIKLNYQILNKNIEIMNSKKGKDIIRNNIKTQNVFICRQALFIRIQLICHCMIFSNLKEKGRSVYKNILFKKSKKILNK